MKKTIKRLDNQVVKALTIACDSLKQRITGFEWLTHSADYANFPKSLVVRCVFDTEMMLKVAKQEGQEALFVKRIHAELLKVGVLLKSPRQHVTFDTEEACMRDHNGNWKKRLVRAH